MNLTTLTSESAEHKSGTIPVAIYPNKMRQRQDGKLTYFAKPIIRGTCFIEDLANDIISSGLNGTLSKEQIVKIAEVLNNAKISRIIDGFLIDDGLARMSAKVSGSFVSDNEAFNSKKHSIGLSMHTSKEVKQLLSDLRPVIRQGNSIKPEITGIYDLESKSSTVLTKGGFLTITGTNICIGGDDADVGLYFDHTEDSSKSIRLSAERLGTNTPSHIACVVPLILSEGIYKIRLVTQAINATMRKKETQSFIYDGAFTVA